MPVIVPPPTPVVVAEPVVLEPVVLTLLALLELAVDVVEVVRLVTDAVVIVAVVDTVMVFVTADVFPVVFAAAVGSFDSVSDEPHCERTNGSAAKPKGTKSVFKFIAAVS